MKQSKGIRQKDFHLKLDNSVERLLDMCLEMKGGTRNRTINRAIIIYYRLLRLYALYGEYEKLGQSIVEFRKMNCDYDHGTEIDWLLQE